MKFLLDTNVISELRKKDRADPNVAAWARPLDAGDLATSVIVLAEIRRGIEMKRRHDAPQAASLDLWFGQVRAGLAGRILPLSETVADIWARINVPDRLPFFDGLLAATALAHGLVLVTRNVADVRNTGAELLDPFAAKST